MIFARVPARSRCERGKNESKRVPTAPQPVIEFRRVSYAPDTVQVLRELTLAIQPRETLVLLGRSGSGKTTTLKLVNRLLLPTEGEVRVEGRATTQWDPILLRRRLGYVIQEVGLFPHVSVERNIGVVPELEKWPAERIRARTRELLQLVGLEEEIASRYPRQLSGWQRQRVAVARALAADPPMLLMDEPFGALDPITRSQLQREFRAMQDRLGKTILFVTHDLREALLLATRIALLEAGKLVLLATAQEFLRSPDPWAVAYRSAFDGDFNSLPGGAP